MSSGLLHCVQAMVTFNAVKMESARDFVGTHWISGLSGLVSIFWSLRKKVVLKDSAVSRVWEWRKYWALIRMDQVLRQQRLGADLRLGWLSKSWSLFGYPKYWVPYYIRDPKRDHNFDNGPNIRHSVTKSRIGHSHVCASRSAEFTE